MNERFVKNWLLALAGALQAVFAVINLLMLNPDGSLVLRSFTPESTLLMQSRFALAAGVCTIAAGLWSLRKARSWFLVLNGLALSAYGLLPVIWSPARPLSFRPVSLLFVVMALSITAFAWAAARRTRGHLMDEWLLGLAGAASVVFAAVFFAIGRHWIRLEAPGSYFIWLASFFSFCAICMIGLALRLNGERATGNGIAAVHAA